MKKKHKKESSHGTYESAEPMVGLPQNTLDAKNHSPKKKKVFAAKKNVEILADSKKKEAKDHKHDVFEAKKDGGSKKKPSEDIGKKWIAGAIKKPGALHAELHVPKGKKIPAKKLAAAAKHKGKEGKRARLAETLKGFHKGK